MTDEERQANIACIYEGVGAPYVAKEALNELDRVRYIAEAGAAALDIGIASRSLIAAMNALVEAAEEFSNACVAAIMELEGKEDGE